MRERPAHIEALKQVGHWECDTVIGAKHKQAIVTVVERKGGYAVKAKVLNKTFELVGSTIINLLNPFTIDRALGSTGYFARPYASCERGCNENFNGLLRQYVTKKSRMETVTDEEINMIENKFNNQPRKRLGFKTPAEVFNQSLARVTLRA